MEEKKTIFDYLAQVMVVFGFSMLVMNVFCLIFGNSAKDFSAMFALGSGGIPVKVVFQFLCISVLLVGIRFVFFTDILIKKMPVWLRTVCMLTMVLVMISVFIIMFRWFPVTMWQPWAMFFICFGLSFVGSSFVMIIKEKAEDRKMEEALRRLKEKENRHE